MPILYRLPKLHKEVFGFDEPASLPYLSRVLMDVWDISKRINPDDLRKRHVLCMNMDALFNHVANGCYIEELWFRATEERVRWVRENFVEQVETLSIIPKWSGRLDGIHKPNHLELMESIEAEGIKVPLTVVEWDDAPGGKWYNYVWEGRHRRIIAAYLGLKTVPAVRLIRVGGEEAESAPGVEVRGGLKMTVWEFADTLRRARKWRKKKC